MRLTAGAYTRRYTLSLSLSLSLCHDCLNPKRTITEIQPSANLFIFSSESCKFIEYFTESSFQSDPRFVCVNFTKSVSSFDGAVLPREVKYFKYSQNSRRTVRYVRFEKSFERWNCRIRSKTRVKERGGIERSRRARRPLPD